MPAPDVATASQLPPDAASLASLGLYTLIAVGLIAVLLLLARLLGRRTSSLLKEQPYESGVTPTGSARLGEPAPFYLVAIFFIVFDVEMIFLASWSVAFEALGWAGFAQITFFIIILFLGLVWLWKVGGLDWGPQPRGDKGGK